MTVYTLRYDLDSGRLIGATRASDGTQFTRNGAGWSDVVAWAGAQSPPVLLNDRAPLTDAERLARTRAAALTRLLSRADDTGIAVRATVAAVVFLINNRLELIDAQLRALGQPGIPAPARVLQAEILSYLQENPTAGDPTT